MVHKKFGPDFRKPGKDLFNTGSNWSFLVTFTIMFSFWILLSGYFDFMHLFLGVISSLFVSFTSHSLLIGDSNIREGFKKIIRFFKYLPWLLYQILLANLDVVYRTLHPGMPIAPRIIKFKTNLETDLAKVILANSITLTPGTVTIDIKEGEFFVHAIAEAPAESLLGGEMQARVKQIEG